MTLFEDCRASLNGKNFRGGVLFVAQLFQIIQAACVLIDSCLTERVGCLGNHVAALEAVVFAANGHPAKAEK